MSSLVSIVAYVEDGVNREASVAVLCHECGERVPDATVNRLWRKRKTLNVCKSGKPIMLNLSELDKMAEALVTLLSDAHCEE